MTQFAVAVTNQTRQRHLFVLIDRIQPRRTRSLSSALIVQIKRVQIRRHEVRDMNAPLKDIFIEHLKSAEEEKKKVSNRYKATELNLSRASRVNKPMRIFFNNPPPP